MAECVDRLRFIPFSSQLPLPLLKDTPMHNSPISKIPRSFLLLAASLTLSALPTVSSGQGLRINEFLAVNDDGIVDGDGDASDWIEIFNGSASALDLSGYSLTDDPADVGKWKIPDGTNLGAGGYLMVFASGKDRAVAGEELHANFRIGANDAFLGLYDASMVLVDAFQRHSGATRRRILWSRSEWRNLAPDLCAGFSGLQLARSSRGCRRRLDDARV